jgi:hypothetical protein
MFSLEKFVSGPLHPRGVVWSSEFFLGDLQPNYTKKDEVAPTLKNQNI